MSSLSAQEVKDIQAAVYELIQKGQMDDAYGLILTLLEYNPNDGIALNFMGVFHLEHQEYQLAYQYFRRALQENPNSAPIWTNYGLATHELGNNKEAISAYLKSAECNNSYAKAYTNAAAVMIEESKWDEAEKLCNLALESDPNDKNAQKNLAHVYLAKHNWKDGWKHWELAIGSKYRKEWIYGDEPRWDGAKGKNLVIYGEQGLGDEVCYASCIPDAINDSKHVVIDCDPRLETLFKRSFPKAKVYGTRRDKHPAWLKDEKIDARVAMASLPSFYRNSDDEFPGTPYLKANPELVKMFKTYFETFKKPVYGVCTHGGSKLTGEHYRTLQPESFSPLFSRDAVFICLDYKNKDKNNKLVYMPWATQAHDYDITAALIASLDCVIGIHTTVMHVANGLGIPTHILIPQNHQWRYELPYVWCKTATLYHQGKDESWRDVIKGVKL